jgi:hypothetical protein
VTVLVRVILRAFGKLQRPLAWFVAVSGLVMFVGVAFKLIAESEPRLTLIVITADFFLGGISAVMEVENELDSEASAEEPS